MCGYPFKAQGRYLIFAYHRKDTNYLSASICGLTRTMNREDDVYKILSASKDVVEDVCGEEALEARRLERLRESGQKREDLERDTRDLLEKNR